MAYLAVLKFLICFCFAADIYAFNVKEMYQKSEGAVTNIKHHNVIYNLIADLRESISSKLPVVPEEKIIGMLVWKYSKL